MINTIGIAVKGKGALNLFRRIFSIGRKYGISYRKMDKRIEYFAGILDEYDCSATFALVAAALARNKGMVEKHQSERIEFAIHGYYHIDQSNLSLEMQTRHIMNAKMVFETYGLTASGFRCPYLRWNEDTLTSVKQAGLLYDTSQAIAWGFTKGSETDAYHRALGFYNAKSAEKYTALPHFDNGIVQIPYCVPDDEALIERLKFSTKEDVAKPWLSMLREIHRRGELFTLGLHPERIYQCEASLKETLQAARQLRPKIWFARLDSISRWWLDRASTQITLTNRGEGVIELKAIGPEGLSILFRNVATKTEAQQWDGANKIIYGTSFTFRANKRPFIGVSPSSSPYLASFLRQQGYIVEMVNTQKHHDFFFDEPEFGYEDERALLDQIENSDKPLVRLSRWPKGAKSALCITGDIDALTIWDYWYRFLGR